MWPYIILSFPNENKNEIICQLNKVLPLLLQLFMSFWECIQIKYCIFFSIPDLSENYKSNH